MRTNWTAERQRRAADLSAEGYGATAIAAQLGVTKDAAASAMRRYGLFARPRPSRQQKKQEELAA